MDSANENTTITIQDTKAHEAEDIDSLFVQESQDNVADVQTLTLEEVFERSYAPDYMYDPLFEEVMEEHNLAPPDGAQRASSKRQRLNPEFEHLFPALHTATEFLVGNEASTSFASPPRSTEHAGSQMQPIWISSSSDDEMQELPMSYPSSRHSPIHSEDEEVVPDSQSESMASGRSLEFNRVILPTSRLSPDEVMYHSEAESEGPGSSRKSQYSVNSRCSVLTKRLGQDSLPKLQVYVHSIAPTVFQVLTKTTSWAPWRCKLPPIGFVFGDALSRARRSECNFSINVLHPPKSLIDLFELSRKPTDKALHKLLVAQPRRFEAPSEFPAENIRRRAVQLHREVHYRSWGIEQVRVTEGGPTKWHFEYAT